MSPAEQLKPVLDLKHGSRVNAKLVRKFFTEPNTYPRLDTHDIPDSMTSDMDLCFTGRWTDPVFDWQAPVVEFVPMFLVKGAVYDIAYLFESLSEEENTVLCGNNHRLYQWGFSHFLMIIFVTCHGTY